MADKYIKKNEVYVYADDDLLVHNLEEVEGLVVSTGVPDAGKIIALNAYGKIDVSLLAGSPSFATVKLTDLTDGYLPYHVSDIVGLADSPIFTNGTNVGIGTTTPVAKLAINGGLHVGGDTDPGDNNALIDGTCIVTGVATLTSQPICSSLNVSALVGTDASRGLVSLTDIPTAVTIGGAYIYRAAGTDVAVADGGTGLSIYAVGDIVHATATGTLAGLADVAVGSYLRSGGVNTIALWSTLILPNAATAFRLPVATSANTIGELVAVGATGEYLKGNTGAIPSWATLNQAAVAGLTTADGPTFAHLHITDLAAITTAAESWVGPSNVTGVYFKGGNVGIGTTAPNEKLEIIGSTTRLANIFGISTDDVNTTLKVKSIGTSAGDYPVTSDTAVTGYNAILNIGASATGEGTYSIHTRGGALLATGLGKVGIGTTAPLRRLDVNEASGNCLRLIYNDPDGSPANYVDFLVSSGGDLIITPSGADILLSADTTKLNFGAGNDMTVWYDGTYGQIKTSDVAASDLRVTCGADKTIELQNVVWDDVNVSLVTAKVPAANFPTWAAFTTNLYSYTFALNDYADLSTAEILHCYKEGTDLGIHLHLVTNGLNDATERKAKYTVYYSWGDMDEVMSGEGSLTQEVTIAANLADRTHLFLDMLDITGATYKIGSMLKLRVKRIAGTGTEPAADPFVEQVGIHYQINTIGSRQELIK